MQTPVGPFHFLRLSALSARERILYYYLSVLRRAERQGLPRRRTQTPYEYDATLSPNLPSAQQELASLTQAFVEARYSPHTVDARQTRQVHTYWQQVKAALRALRDGKRSEGKGRREGREEVPMKNHAMRRLATRAVHAGTRSPQPDFTPTVVPIHPSVTYTYERMEDLDGVFAGTREGYVYTRYGNPTVTALEEAVAALEEGETALAFASGMAAIHAALLATGARAGSAIVAAQDVYGATYALLDGLLRSQGVTVRFVDVADLEAVETACAELAPVALLVETISNPLLKVADLPALAGIAHQHGAALLVDNTFATPCLVQPLSLGADAVVHSATKYLGGHGDALGGIVVTSAARRARLFEVLKVSGANLGPAGGMAAAAGHENPAAADAPALRERPGGWPTGWRLTPA